MNISNFLKTKHVIVNLKPSSKEDALVQVSQKLAALSPDLDPAIVHRKIIEREKQSSTAIGGGVAIPHSTMTGIQDPICILAQIPEGLAFDSPDGEPVYLIFMVIFPEQSTGIQLKLLARIARLCSYQELVQELKEAQTPDQLFDLLRKEDSRHV